MNLKSFREWRFWPVRMAAPNIVVSVVATATVGWFLYLVLWSDAAWLHPEVLGSSVYVWLYPGQESLAGMMRKVFDWKAFDPNVNRVRPFNDLFEVIDAIARPYITIIFGVQASFNISTVFTAILAPSFLFGWLRRVMTTRFVAVLLTLLFVSTTGFLSLTVAYLHPAKKINVVCLCASLFFAENARLRQSGKYFEFLCGSLLVSFFSDELGLGNYIIIAMMYWRIIIVTKRHMLLFACLPVVFLVIAKWVLPAIYLKYGVHGLWNALGDAKKFAVFAYLIDFEFQKAAAIQLARSILSTVGISSHTPISEVGAIVVLLGVPIIHVFRAKRYSLYQILDDRLVVVTLAVIVASGYATLLDWYPFPHEISYLGSFNYYYHSSMVVLIIAWLAFALNAYGIERRPTLVVLAGGAIVILNFAIFGVVNELVEIIHYYPYSRNAVFDAVRSGTMTGLAPSADHEERKFEAALKVVFGSRWRANGFYETHRMLVGNGSIIMTQDQLRNLVRAYRPWTK